jgi:hypothetical protein
MPVLRTQPFSMHRASCSQHTRLRFGWWTVTAINPAGTSLCTGLPIMCCCPQVRPKSPGNAELEKQGVQFALSL